MRNEALVEILPRVVVSRYGFIPRNGDGMVAPSGDSAGGGVLSLLKSIRVCKFPLLVLCRSPTHRTRGRYAQTSSSLFVKLTKCFAGRKRLRGPCLPPASHSDQPVTLPRRSAASTASLGQMRGTLVAQMQTRHGVTTGKASRSCARPLKPQVVGGCGETICRPVEIAAASSRRACSSL